MSNRVNFSEQSNQWVNYLNREYINNYGPYINIFRLDKEQTKKHELYMEEGESGRIYLPPYEMNVLYNTGVWTGTLDIGLFSENEQNFVLFANFDEMIHRNREQKNKRSVEIFLEYDGEEKPSIKKKNEEIVIYLDGNEFKRLDLNEREYKSTQKLTTYLNSLMGFKCRHKGKNTISKDIVDFSLISFEGFEIMFYVKDETYKNVSEVIEMGDAILTERNRLYEVIEARPAGEFGWDYNLWRLECKLAKINMMNLPDNWSQRIINNEYGLRAKTKME